MRDNENTWNTEDLEKHGNMVDVELIKEKEEELNELGGKKGF